MAEESSTSATARARSPPNTPSPTTACTQAHAPTHIAPTRYTHTCTQSKEAGGNKNDKRGAVALRQPYLRVVGLQEDSAADGSGAPVFTCVALLTFTLNAQHNKKSA